MDRSENQDVEGILASLPSSHVLPTYEICAFYLSNFRPYWKRNLVPLTERKMLSLGDAIKISLSLKLYLSLDHF